MKLVCFDVDGTLIDMEGYLWDVLHDAFMVPLDVRTASKLRYAAGELSYAAWVASDIMQWQQRGIAKAHILAVVKKLTLMPGVEETLRTLHNRDITLAVLSGSLDIALDTLLQRQQFAHVHLNRITFSADGLISGWVATPYDMMRKVDGLKAIAAACGTTLPSCAYVGDNENDIEVLKAAGLGIAFNPKSDTVRQAADVVVEGKDLRGILAHV